MTSNGDIVERLRQNPSSELEQEAADEIERLRAALVIARKYARTDADAASIAWAEGTITYMRRQLEQQAVQIQRDDWIKIKCATWREANRERWRLFEGRR
jgi:hypothetical protein